MGKRMFRTNIEHHKETTPGTGAWQSFCEIFRDADRKGGYCKSVTIHYLLDDRNVVSSTDSGSLLSGMGFGLMFAASTSASLETVGGESNQLDPNDLLHVRARNGVAGSVTLPIRHFINSNSEDTAEQDGKVTLWLKSPDVTTDDTLVIRFFIECEGRWVFAQGL